MREREIKIVEAMLSPMRGQVPLVNRVYMQKEHWENIVGLAISPSVDQLVVFMVHVEVRGDERTSVFGDIGDY